MKKFKSSHRIEGCKNTNKFTNEKIGDSIFHDHNYEVDFQTYLIRINDNFDLSKFLDSLKMNNSITKLIKVNKNLQYLDNLDYNKQTLHIWSKDYKYINDLVFESGDHEIKRYYRRQKSKTYN